MPSNWNNITNVVSRALALDSRVRAAFVDEACGDSAAMRREVEARLAAYARTGDAPAPHGAMLTKILPVTGAATTGEAANPVRIGTVVDGKYRIDSVLGVGGMGAVYRATHLQLERSVAVKGIRGELLANPAMAERFRTEAVAVARLRHPHIVTVHDYGVAEGFGAYLVMELLEGHSLREELRGRIPLDASKALALVAQVCAAVGAAHRAGVVHRDLKPENIFLEKRDGGVSVKVVDFGLAKLGAAVASGDWGTPNGGELLGTPGYMSPEQCRGDEADSRSDIYAIGCVLFEMLTGERPFSGESVWSVLCRHVEEEPRRPGETVIGLSPTIDDAVVRALAKSPDERYQTAEAFAAALGATTQNASSAGAVIGASPVRRPANNLPFATTRFVGRVRQIGEVRGWLSRARLVTLVGPGGIGKTRLALETAARALDEYEDGGWVVDLAPVSDPKLVARAVGAALGVRDHGGKTETDDVVAWLRDRRVLLVLDNCEHLIGACAELIERLLGACAGLRVLATSRESLGIAGEAVWQVPALGVPAGHAEDALECEAARLFIDRASLVKPAFEVTGGAAPAVAELCRRLEGIPLAIELAAARVRTLTVEQILDRLDDRFRLLAGRSRSSSARQQTLRATLDWSHELLTEDERALFRRLSVFVGGWTLADAEAVAADPYGDGASLAVLELLTRLVDKSLVVAQGRQHDGRFRMLEIVREYGLERLRASGEAEAVARRHADVFIALAERSKTRFVGPREAEWLSRLETEHDNLRAALGWLLEHEPDRALALAASVTDFWSLRGHFAEGARWLRAALDASPPVATARRVVAMRAAGELAWRRGDLASAREHLEASLDLAREADDARQVAWSTFHLALVIQQQGDLHGSRVYLEESLAKARAIGDDRLLGNALNSMGEAARIDGAWDAALPYYEQSLEIHRRLDHPTGISLTLCNLGAALCDSGDIESAQACYTEALPSLRELGNAIGVSLALDGLGALAAKRSEWRRAARLAGAAAAVRDAVGGELEPADRSLRERSLRDVRAHLGDAGLASALAEGRATARDRAIEEALSA